MDWTTRMNYWTHGKWMMDRAVEHSDVSLASCTIRAIQAKVNLLILQMSKHSHELPSAVQSWSQAVWNKGRVAHNRYYITTPISMDCEGLLNWLALNPSFPFQILFRSFGKPGFEAINWYSCYQVLVAKRCSFKPCLPWTCLILI